MKPILKYSLLVLVIGNVLFLSCSKDSQSPLSTSTLTPPQAIDTLSGKEFIFSELIWDYRRDDFNELYTMVNRPDLFNAYHAKQVFVKSITDTIWVLADVVPTTTSPYVYSVELGGRLVVEPYPTIYPLPWSPNNQLANTKVSIKVKFL